MKRQIINLYDYDIEVISLNTAVVGSGAAGFNAADTLFNLGQKDIAIITEGINMGTSRNTGSDKQTYYKLSLSGEGGDSVYEMAKTLMSGGCMHGDIALVESALSAKCFYKLVEIGVPFPHNRYGEYIGYKTDHDPRQRATSAGPLTSKFMTEKLEEQIKTKNIKIFDGYQIIAILTKENDKESKQCIGLLALNLNILRKGKVGLTLFNCTNAIYATGGPAAMYKTSVYPECHNGSTGTALEAGAKGINLTESQYGIASIKFRWNLSGTYQQVLPRYVSTDIEGNDEKEFLNEYFETPGQMLDAVFLKGYQWPFDPKKIKNFGSSLIDILVYYETQIKKRRVFLDFTNNPSWGSINKEIDFSILSNETYAYLENSNVLFGNPIERLLKMNRPAIELYLNNGIDLKKEYLEIAVCAQHNNGGLKGNIWWESNIKNLFPIGEVNGTFGIYRPGGSALNSTQVGSTRAAQYIAAKRQDEPRSAIVFVNSVKEQIKMKIDIINELIKNKDTKSNVLLLREKYQKRMSKCGAHIRSLDNVQQGIKETNKSMSEFVENTKIKSENEIGQAFINRDILLTQAAYLASIQEYINKGGRSRGSYLISDKEGVLPSEKLSREFKFTLDNKALNKKVLETELVINNKIPEFKFYWEEVREIPKDDNWFENIWNKYLKGEIIY